MQKYRISKVTFSTFHFSATAEPKVIFFTARYPDSTVSICIETAGIASADYLLFMSVTFRAVLYHRAPHCWHRLYLHRVIVNDCYKIKQLACYRILYFQISMCIPVKWVMGHLISTQYFVTQSNYFLIMSDSLSTLFGTSGALALSMNAAKLIVLKQEAVKSAHGVRRADRKQIYYSHTSSQPSILTTTARFKNTGSLKPEQSTWRRLARQRNSSTGSKSSSRCTTIRA